MNVVTPRRPDGAEVSGDGKSNTIHDIYIAHWIVTDACNEQCLFCHQADHGVKSTNLEQGTRILESLARGGWRRIKFTGGEPLLHQDLPALMALAKQLGFEVHLHTNGLLLDEAYLDRISGHLDLLSLALDAPTDNAQRRMTRGAAHFRQTMKVLTLGQQRGVPLSVKTVLSSRNRDQMGDLGELLTSFDLSYWVVAQFRPLDRGAEYAHLFSIDDADFEEIVGDLVSRFSERIEVVPVRGKEAHFPYLFIQPDGTVRTVDPTDEGYIELGSMLRDDVFELRARLVQTFQTEA